MTGYCDFIKRELGDNWVLARRTSRIIAKYGENVNCVSKKQLTLAERKYRLANGQEYDAPRAAMYLALKQIHDHLANGDNCPAICQELARAAIVAEQETF